MNRLLLILITLLGLFAAIIPSIIVGAIHP